MKPADLFYTTAAYDKCHVSQTEEQHFLKANGGILATDVACRFDQDKAQKAIVYAPDYVGESREYIVLKVGFDSLLGNYIEIGFDTLGGYKGQIGDNMGLHNAKWIIAHIETKKKEGDIIETGEVLGQMDISGATTGYHTHIELWKLIDGSWQNVSYSTRSQSLQNRRNGTLDTSVKKSDPLYFTSYHLGDVNQNDSTPCIGASGKDLCQLMKTGVKPIALTKDIRNLYGIKFGDKIRMEGPCSGEYQVEDEMNIRFRTSCINKQGACIKGDIAMNLGDTAQCSGVYQITF